ncbi:hypothetical protein [Lacticaseibacillus paracasei]|nr:hypothetical protein [Lacticaseibacillus paracasei]MDE3278843.1 hypothetical protein [Lacticaseibacillus paracasei]
MIAFGLLVATIINGKKK